jgi:hypothetical protein
MRIRPWDKNYWEQLAGPISDAEFGAASIAAIAAAQRGEGRKKIKHRGRRAIQLKRKAKP